MSGVPPFAWIGFLAFVALAMVADLSLLHRRAHVIRFREALRLSVVWISLALIMFLVVFLTRGAVRGLEFLTGYLVELSLSVDNLFVFLVIFSYFSLPPRLYHVTLIWGILGALVFRGAMIFGGAALIAKFHWVLYVFGAFLILTAVKLALHREQDVDPGRNLLVRAARRMFPVSSGYRGGRFFVTRAGRIRAVTPLFIVVLAVESTDIVFAVDSIPAIFAITRDSFIVFTSNIFAVLGLRALFFMLAGVIPRFRYLRFGLAIVLAVIGAKMLIEKAVEIPIWVSLGAVCAILSASILLSGLKDWQEAKARKRALTRP